MQKRHFELMAEMCRALFWHPDVPPAAWRAFCTEMADNLRSTNVRFDRDRFLQACRPRHRGEPVKSVEIDALYQ